MLGRRYFIILLAAIAVQFVPDTARADDLFELKPSNKVLACSPQVLNDDSILTIGMPKKHGDFLVVRGSDLALPVYVVYPKPRWPLKLTARQFRTLPTLKMRVGDMMGIHFAVGPAFPFSDTYEIIVGSGFDTPRPVIDGWCSVTYQATRPRRDAEHADARRPAQLSKPITCEPRVVRPGDTLHITMAFPHGPYLTIREPNAEPHSYLFLTVPFRTQAELGDSAISGTRFQRMRTLDVVVSKTKAIPWEADAKPRRIFRRRGAYLFELGHQFETEAQIVQGACTVEFQP